MMPYCRCLIILCLWLSGPLNAQAEHWQSIDSIREAALSTVPASTQAQAQVDAHVRLPHCPIALQARASQRTRAEVYCPQAGGWRLFVPLIVRQEREVLIVTHRVAAGHVLIEEDIGSARRDTSRSAANVFNDRQQVLGRTTRHSLAAGSVISTQDVHAPQLIRRGDSVNLLVEHAGFQVRMTGKALGTAGVGERLRVENLSSHQIVQGLVNAQGEVQITSR